MNLILFLIEKYYDRDIVGYADDKAFREVFKRIAGLSPLEYKAKYQQRRALA